MKNLIQDIDARLGISVRLYVRSILDEWLMDSNNMTVWEVGVTACEQRILIIVFVSKDLACVMESGIECMQVGCFE